MKDLPEIRLSPELGLPQQVAEHLAGEIREGALKLGQKLAPEADLCKKYGVSRTVIREAVARLRHDGPVGISPGKRCHRRILGKSAGLPAGLDQYERSVQYQFHL